MYYNLNNNSSKVQKAHNLNTVTQYFITSHLCSDMISSDIYFWDVTTVFQATYSIPQGFALFWNTVLTHLTVFYGFPHMHLDPKKNTPSALWILQHPWNTKLISDIITIITQRFNVVHAPFKKAVTKMLKLIWWRVQEIWHMWWMAMPAELS